MIEKVSVVAHQLWLEARLGELTSTRNAIVSLLLAKKETFRSFLFPLFNIYRLQGQNQAGQLTVIYVGTKTSLGSLQRMLFTGKSTRTKIGRVPVWQIHKLITSPGSDIVVIEAGKQLLDKLPWQKAIVMPSIVHLLLDIRGTWDEIKGRFGKSARDEFRLTRKHGYTYRISRTWHDFEHFYEKMYVPTMRERRYPPLPKSNAAVYFKHGLLFLAERDGQAVAGGLWYPQEKTLKHILLGILNGDERLRKEGAGGAVVILCMQWANREGFETLNFLRCEPFLNSGMFQYKRKWGSKVTIPLNEDKRIWLKVQRNTRAVFQFLKGNPAIVLDRKNALHGLIVTDDPTNISPKTRADWQNKFGIPGLESFLVCTMEDFADEPLWSPEKL